VQFQRAPEGHPLDDVVVHAHDARGKPAILEVQVKKALNSRRATNLPFSRGQIEQASRKPEFLNGRYELAVAISKTSHKIDGATRMS